MDPAELQALVGASVLIVEDEGIVAKDLQRSLRSLGYEISGRCASAEDAVAKAVDLRPDLVLMDIRLRGEMDGIEAARQIRRRIDVPVVFLTAYADPDTLARAGEVAPHGYVLKPFDERELQVTLTMALCKHRVDARVREAERVAEEERIRASIAEDALEARDEFLSVAAHELRTPVAALQLQLTALRELLKACDSTLDPRIAEKSARAEQTVARLANLIEGVLDVSRIALGGIELDMEDFDLTGLVREVTVRHEDLAKRAGCELRVRTPDPVPGRWDRMRVEQVLTNLLSNAIKFGAGKPIEVILERRERQATLTVRDRGEGIDPEDAERILERFERGVSHRHYGGLGLGLYIAGQIVREHGGELKVSSPPGQGATITVELPCHPQTQQG